jgi:hypothetical protein
VCWDSPIPQGYVVVGHATSINCAKRPDGLPNQKSIKIPGAEERVCWDSPIPSGYVVVSELTSNNCARRPDNLPNQKLIRKQQQ